MWIITFCKKTYKNISSIETLYWKKFNMLLFKMKGVKFGRNMQVYNKTYLQIRKGKFSIGDNFTLTSGDCINPLCRNIRACIFITHGGTINIGNNVGMSSPCIWVRNSLTIGNNVNIGGNCTIMDNDVHQIEFNGFAFDTLAGPGLSPVTRKFTFLLIVCPHFAPSDSKNSSTESPGKYALFPENTICNPDKTCSC